MVSVAIWLVSARNFTHALLVFADLSAENGFTPDECEAMQCGLGFACSMLKRSESLSTAARGGTYCVRERGTL
jgi:hypothetical protein